MTHEQHDGSEVDPEEADGHGDDQENHDHTVERQREEIPVLAAKGLATDWLEARGESHEDRVACDVCESDRESSSGKLEATETAEEEDGDDGAHVD